MAPADTVTDFSWEPKGERFVIVSSSDPNLGNPGAGVNIKTDISFYQLDHSKNDFKLLRAYMETCYNGFELESYPRHRHPCRPHDKHHPVVPARAPRRPRDRRLDVKIRAGVLGPRYQLGRYGQERCAQGGLGR